MEPCTEPFSASAAEEIRRQLQRILDSPDFQATERQREFLRFVVTETLGGRHEEIKGYTVATLVFGRNEDFDQATDPIVSIQANQLRRALERYYLIAGSQDPIRIDIPKGTYVPTFHEQTQVESDETAPSPKTPDVTLEASWPLVLIRPFQNMTGDPEFHYLSVGLATELAMEFTRYQEIRVLLANPEGDQRRASDKGARFIINGNIFKDVEKLKVVVSFVDAKTHIQIWSDSIQTNLGDARMFAFQEYVARIVTAKIAGESGVFAKTLIAEYRCRSPKDSGSYEAMLRYYEFRSKYNEETFNRAYESLRLASEREPDCGIIWSMLARLYTINCSLELFDLETPLEEAVSFADKGAQLDPTNQRVRIIRGFVLLFRNEISAALTEVNIGLALNPDSLVFLESIGYILTLLGEWERGPALIRKAIKLNLYYKNFPHFGLWLDWIRRGDYQEAYQETMNFKTPLHFWDPLMKAASSGLLGRHEEGKRSIEDLLKLKPGFPAQGRRLIKHYIKFKDIYERIIEGLQNAGLDIENH